MQSKEWEFFETQITAMLISEAARDGDVSKINSLAATVPTGPIVMPRALTHAVETGQADVLRALLDLKRGKAELCPCAFESAVFAAPDMVPLLINRAGVKLSEYVTPALYARALKECERGMLVTLQKGLKRG